MFHLLFDDVCHSGPANVGPADHFETALPSDFENRTRFHHGRLPIADCGINSISVPVFSR
jgi:hypothetical protein